MNHLRSLEIYEEKCSIYNFLCFIRFPLNLFLMTALKIEITAWIILEGIIKEDYFVLFCKKILIFDLLKKNLSNGGCPPLNK